MKPTVLSFYRESFCVHPRRHITDFDVRATFAVSYGISFAAITATLTHAFLFYRKQIWSQARRSLKEQPDIHARLMSKYEQVPEWYYGVIFSTSFHSVWLLADVMNSVVMFVFAVVSIEVLETGLPVWGKLTALVFLKR